MAFITRDFVKESSVTTGTSDIVLAGARAPGQTFSTVCANGDQVHYAISHDTLNQWEVGIGTYNSGPNTITRTDGNVLDSSSGAGVRVSFAAGTKRVDLVEPASRIRNQVGPVQIGATSFGSGTLSFAGTGISFSLSTNTAGGTVHASAGGLTTNNAFQQITLVPLNGGGFLNFSSNITDGNSASVTGTSLALAQLPSFLTSVASQANVAFYASGASIAAAAWHGIFAGLGGAIAQHIQFNNSNAVSWGGGVSNFVGNANGPGVTITAIVPRIRQVDLYSPSATQLGSITNATDSTLSNSSAATLRFPLLGTANNSFFSTANVQFRLSSDSLIGVAWQRFSAPVGGAQLAQNLEFSNANGASFGMATSSLAGLGKVVFLTASVNPDIGVVSHIGGNVASSVTQLAFSNASNVTWSLSTAANAVTVLASVAAGGGGGITAFNLTNSVSSVAATILNFLNANGASWLLSTGASVGSVSLSYTVPAVVNSGLLQLTNSVSSVNASQAVLSAANGFSFLLSTAASGATVSGSYTVPAVVNSGLLNVTDSVSSVNASRLLFSNANGVTFGIATGASIATVTASVAAAGGGITYSGFSPMKGEEMVVTSVGNGTFMVSPMDAVPAFQFDRIIWAASFTNVTNSTNSNTLRLMAGIYTRGTGASSTLLSLLISTTGTFAFTGSGTVGNYSLFSGLRLLSIGWTSTLSASNYWIAMAHSLSTAGNAGISRSLAMISQNLTNPLGHFNVNTNASVQRRLGQGFFNATSSVAPASMAFNAITGSGVTGWRAPAIHFESGSA